jgi:hypothetical protein
LLHAGSLRLHLLPQEPDKLASPVLELCPQHLGDRLQLGCTGTDLINLHFGKKLLEKTGQIIGFELGAFDE